MKDKIDDIEIYKTTNTGNERIHLMKVNGHTCAIVNSSPFGNCQNFSIKSFRSLVDQLNNIKNIKQAISKIKEVCLISRPLLIVDIRKETYNIIKKHLNFVINKNYKNSNTSDMVLCIIDTRQ